MDKLVSDCPKTRKKQPYVPLEPIARQTAHDPFFIGYSLVLFRKTRRMTDLDLAEYLKMPVTKLSRLSICRRPQRDESDYQEKLRRISSFCECDIDRLLSIC